MKKSIVILPAVALLSAYALNTSAADASSSYRVGSDGVSADASVNPNVGAGAYGTSGTTAMDAADANVNPHVGIGAYTFGVTPGATAGTRSDRSSGYSSRYSSSMPAGASASAGMDNNRSTDYRNSGAAADYSTGSSSASTSANAQTQDSADIQLHREELRVGKREVQNGGVYLRKTVTSERVEQPVELRREEIVIDRVPAGDTSRTTSTAGRMDNGAAFQNQEIFIPLSAETPTVSKDVVVTETIRAHKRVVTDRQTVGDTVRRENIDIVRNPGQMDRNSGSVGAPASGQSGFGRSSQGSFRSTGADLNNGTSSSTGSSGVSGSVGNGAASGSVGTSGAGADIGNGAASANVGDNGVSGSVGNGAVRGNVGPGGASGSVGNDAASGSVGTGGASGQIGNGAASGTVNRDTTLPDSASPSTTSPNP